MFLFIRVFRKLAYEISLVVHRVTAALCAYAIWAHISSYRPLALLYLYTGLGILIVLVIRAVSLLYRNGVFTSHAQPRASISRIWNLELDNKDMDNSKYRLIKVCVSTSQPMKVNAGQYINLHFLSASWWSWAQSHPFMVVSWSNEAQESLELIVQPRNGLTADLFHLTSIGPEPTMSLPAFISGPHGVSQSVEEYETILMVASELGVVAIIPYLKRLIYGYKGGISQTRRIHFVWQLHTLG